MNNRLLDIIKYKTGGRQNKFAELVGWTPQYLAKLLRGDNFGLQPVLTLLEKLPEINARWLLLGQGSMLNDEKVACLRRDTISRAESIMRLERFIPVMSADEIRIFEKALQEGICPVFSDEQMERWSSLLAARQWTLEARVQDAISKSMM